MRQEISQISQIYKVTQKAAIKWEESLSLLKLSRAWAGSNEVQIADIAEILENGSFEFMLTVLRPALMLKVHDFPCVQAPR